MSHAALLTGHRQRPMSGRELKVTLLVLRLRNFVLRFELFRLKTRLELFPKFRLFEVDIVLLWNKTLLCRNNSFFAEKGVSLLS